jgi:hypothetical protein
MLWTTYSAIHAPTWHLLGAVLFPMLWLTPCLCLLASVATIPTFPWCSDLPQASLSHGDNQMVTVVGAGVLRMFKVAEGTLKPLPLAANKRDTLTFTCHSWVPPEKEGAAGDKDQRQLMGTADGEILLFEVRAGGGSWPCLHLCASCTVWGSTPRHDTHAAHAETACQPATAPACASQQSSP